MADPLNDIINIAKAINQGNKKHADVPRFVTGRAFDLSNGLVAVEVPSIDADGNASFSAISVAYVGWPPAVDETVWMVDFGQGRWLCVGTQTQSGWLGPWTAPWGKLSYKEHVDATSYTNTTAAVDALASTISSVAGRKIKVTIEGAMNTSAAPGETQLRLDQDNVPALRRNYPTAFAGENIHTSLEWCRTTDGKMSCERAWEIPGGRHKAAKGMVG